MKKKYFMRGLGTGVVFATIIMLAAYMTSGAWQKMTDEEIKKRAKQLGMVDEQVSVLADTEGTAEEIDDSDSITDLVDNSKETKTTAEATTEELITEATSTEEMSEEATTEATTEETTEEATTEKETTEKQDSKTKAQITVKGGMGSQEIAKLLADAGLVKSASDFDSYLCQNGYDSKLEVGTFDLEGTMTYEELAKTLCKKK